MLAVSIRPEQFLESRQNDLNAMKNKNVNQPVLILGCGRSGTSVFGEFFDGLEGYTYFSEPPFSEILDTFGPGVAIKVPNESENFEADPGLSFPLNTLLEKTPETIIFWIVRHPLDAVCSLRIGIGQNWRHHPRPPDWQSWLNRPLIERCAHHWVYVNSFGFDAVAGKTTLVRFEDMVHAPFEFAKKIISVLGLTESQHKNSMQRWSDRVQNTNNDKFVEALTSRTHSRPDHSVRIGRWRENLSADEAKSVVDLVSKTNSRFGYDLTINEI